MSLSALADEDLMQLVRRGDTLAFEVVYERHATAAFSLAYRMTGTRNVAEDVVQEAFLALWRSGARYDRTRGSVRTWVLGIVHNRAIDALRRSVVHERRRARGALRVGRPHRRGGRPARRGARGPRRAARAAARAEPGHRARVLRRLHAQRDRGDARHAHRDGQGPHAPRPREAARPARARHGGDGMSTEGHRPECEFGLDAGAYVLGALPPDELDAFAAHLAGCDACRREVAQLRGVVDALPLAAAQVAPPPELKDRLMTVVRAESDLLHAAGSEPAARAEPRRR